MKYRLRQRDTLSNNSNNSKDDDGGDDDSNNDILFDVSDAALVKGCVLILSIMAPCELHGLIFALGNVCTDCC